MVMVAGEGETDEDDKQQNRTQHRITSIMLL